ncbi:MAG TPA: hypothetical protein VIB62_08800 [Actinomycetota bacterium]
MRRAGSLVVALGIALWPAAAFAQAREPVDPPEQVVLSGDANVPRGRVVGQVVVFHGRATIAGVVSGDVVVVDGPIVVAGQVSGDVVAVDGSIRLQSTAQVGGSVLGGDRVTVVEGATVGGDVREGISFTLAGSVSVLGALLASAAMAASILITGLLLILIAPRGADGVARAGLGAPLASAGWGVLLVLVVPIVAVAAALTIVGLPFGLAVVLGLGLVWLIGQAWVTYTIGRMLVREPRSRIGAMFAGWGIGAAIGLVPVLNGIWWGVGSVFGLGAMTVAAWRVRRGPGAATELPSPPATSSGRRAKGGRHAAGRVATSAPAAPELQDEPSP